jgi:hypothetical protein
MKVQTVTVSAGLKASLGNYNMANFNYSLSGELEDSDTPESAKAQLEELIDEWLRTRLEGVKKANGLV